MTKNYNPVISGRIPEELMEKVKQECIHRNWSNTELLCHVLESFFNDNVYNEIDGCIQTEKENEYKHLQNILKKHKDELRDYYQFFKKDDDDSYNFTVAELIGCDIETVEIIESLIKIQLNNGVDQKRTPEKKDKPIWEEG